VTYLFRCLVLLSTLLASGCASLSQGEHARAVSIAQAAQSQQVQCQAADACAEPSALYALAGKAQALSTAQVPRHYALLLDYGEDALLARLNLLRSARHSIDLQTYIFDTDDSARLVIDELLAAARRGVQVRVLIDQLSAINDLQTLGALAGAHRNFQLRIYNPTFGKADPSYLDYAGSVLCCFRRFNQRMHTKLLVVDGAIGITGGRNYQDDYFDWDSEFNFRDRDVLIAGPAARDMARSFGQFWDARLSVPVAQLNDVGRYLLRHGVPALPDKPWRRPERVQAMAEDASDPEVVAARLVEPALPVGTVSYVADPPQKHRHNDPREPAPSSWELGSLVYAARQQITLQTPYLVMSDAAEDMFRSLRKRPEAPRVTVSTNSLAATDNPIVYSVSHKYKRRYLRELGFNIYEFKPFPADAPVDYASMLEEPPVLTPEQSVERPVRPIGSIGSKAGSRRTPRNRVDRRVQRTENRPSFFSSSPASDPLPLKRAGVRMGLHAKSMVIDGRVAVVGTHNFDPRSVNYNTESVVVIPSPVFARELEASIRRDISPENSWVIAPRRKPVVFSGLNYSLDKVSSSLPVFDLWPWRYATSYEYVASAECPTPVPRNDPKFHVCYRDVGDFPEVSIGPKRLYARILIAFGGGLVPIL